MINLFTSGACAAPVYRVLGGRCKPVHEWLESGMTKRYNATQGVVVKHLEFETHTEPFLSFL